MSRRSLRLAVSFLLAAGFAPVAWAQFQVDTRTGGELYGNDNEGNPARFHPYQTRLLPSEERYATWRSGALPSEITQNRFEIGPLSPNGIIDYIPRQSRLQRAARMPAPQLVNPAYDAEARLAASRVEGPAAKPGFAQSNPVAKPASSPPRQLAIPGLTPVPDLSLPSAGQLPTGQLQPAPLERPRPDTVFAKDPPVRIGTVYYRRPTPTRPEPPTQNPVPATKPAY
jgi:hypothetical protein